MYGFVSPERINNSSAFGHSGTVGPTLEEVQAPRTGADVEEIAMAARRESPRRGLRASLGGNPVVPLVGMCVGVVALTAAVTLGGEDSSSTTDATNDGETGVVTTTTAAEPSNLPAANTCALRVAGTSRGMSVTDARTLTQIAAVGWQVKAPEEMVARVLDVATAKPNQTPSVTDALDLFTREDVTAPSADAVAEVRALTEPGGLTCVFDSPAVPVEAKKSSGLTPRAEVMRQGVIDAFGRLTMSGYGRKAPKNSPESAGRALNVAVAETAPSPDATTLGATTPGASAGWVLAHWLMARGADYKLATIAYGDRVWAPRSGWQSATPGQAGANVRPGRVYVAVTAGVSGTKATSGKDAKKAENRKSEKRKANRRS